MTAQSTSDARYVVYKSIVGDYDSLHDPLVPSEDARFICFTDNRDVRSKVWKLVHAAPNGNRTDQNRRLKINPHLYLPEHDYSLYIDRNVRDLGSLGALFEKYRRITEIAAPRHPAGNCLCENAATCIANSKGDAVRIREIVASYARAGFPQAAGLFEFHILFRRTFSTNVLRLMAIWWSEYEKGGCRDQITFQYAAWRCGAWVAALDESAPYTTKLLRLAFHKSQLHLPFQRKTLLYARLNRANSVACRVIADAGEQLESSAAG